jgi:hypothetical protein
MSRINEKAAPRERVFSSDAASEYSLISDAIRDG